MPLQETSGTLSSAKRQLTHSLLSEAFGGGRTRLGNFKSFDLLFKGVGGCGGKCGVGKHGGEEADRTRGAQFHWKLSHVSIVTSETSSPTSGAPPPLTKKTGQKSPSVSHSSSTVYVGHCGSHFGVMPACTLGGSGLGCLCLTK